MSALYCPRCADGSDYLHHGRVEVFERPEDADYVTRTVVDGKITAVDYMPNAGSGNPSSRRHGRRIHFWCEYCGDGLILDLAQHKGKTLTEWAISPASAVWLEKQRRLEEILR
jgi:hypothetical protein